MSPRIQLRKRRSLCVLFACGLVLLSLGAVSAQQVGPDQAQVSLAPAACVPLPAGSTPESLANSMIVALNQWRVANGYTAVAFNNLLANAALAHSQEMSQYNYVSHTGRDGSTPGQRATAAGYNYTVVGENLEAGLVDADAIIRRWWQQSPDHLRVMQMPVREIGVGYVYDPNDRAGVDLGDGQTSGPYCHYWTLMVGTRSLVYPVVINRGATTTNSRNVLVSIAAGNASGIAEIPSVRFASQPQWDSVPWVAFTGQEFPFVLPAGDGIKTIYSQVKWSNIVPVDAIAATIRLQTTPPKARVFLPRITRSK